ncbi:hypothetical protein [Ktedonobacter racemifer]|uniref:hypothetical protein n=1 Tax=Ktedonobacter racemifer TaxID=363277 RepID=UPI001469EE01|nr:hypothetical protein [Ktedonobacter racemifer]
MTGSSWSLGVKPQAEKVALVSQELPDFPAYGRVVAIVAPSSPDAFAAPGGFEGFQRFHQEQRAPMDLTQQQQGVACQVGHRRQYGYYLMVKGFLPFSHQSGEPTILKKERRVHRSHV